MCIPKSNHKKLIDECYPPAKSLAGAGPEYKPNGNELSRLAYYANRKPAKLSKVGKVLEQRAATEAKGVTGSGQASEKAKGGLMVTLGITKELITECKRDLNYFSSSVEAILSSALQAAARGGANARRDLEITARASSTFYAFASYVDPPTASADATVGKSYQSLLSDFSQIATEPLSDHDEQNRARIIGLGALAGAVGSDALYTTSFSQQASSVIPALLANILPGQVDSAFLKSESKKVAQGLPSYAVYAAKRRPMASRRALSLSGPLQENKGPSTESVASAAMGTLQTLLHNGDASHVQASVASVISFLDGKSRAGSQWADKEWCCWLSEAICRWTALQYRFVVVTALVELLVEEGDGQTQDKHFTLIAMITRLLNCDLSMIGLSTSDTSNNLLGLTVRRVHKDTRDALLPPLVDCISALGTHIYYADQLNDMAEEISARIIALQLPEPDTAVAAKTSLDNRKAVKTDEEARDESIRALLACITGLIDTAHRSSGEVHKGVDAGSKAEDKDNASNQGMALSAAGTRNRISTSVWHQTTSLLGSPNHAVRLAYSQALHSFFETEVSPSPTLDNDPLADNLGSKLSIEATGFTHSYSAALYVLALSKFLYVPTTAKESPLESLPVIDRANADEVRDSTGAKSASALPIDYAGLSEVLSRMYEHIPVAGLLGTVPALLALQRNIGNRLSEKGGIGGATAQRKSAAKYVVARAFSKIAQVWDVSQLDSAAKAFMSRSAADNLPDLPATPRGFALPGKPVPFSDTSFVGGDSSDDSSTINARIVIESLSNNAKVQSATGLDSNALKNWFGRDWSVQIAVDDSFIGASPFKSPESSAGTSFAAARLPDAQHPTDAYAQSTTSSQGGSVTKGVGVDDFREALGNRSYGSGGRKGSGFVSQGTNRDLSSGGALSGTDRRASRRVSRKAGAHPNGGPKAMADGGLGGLLDRMHVGIDEDEPNHVNNAVDGTGVTPKTNGAHFAPPYAA